ncbi:hypothetical protein LJR034_009010 [Caballeronia sp. LjRoot34]
MSLVGVAIDAVEYSLAAAARVVEMGATGEAATQMKSSLRTSELLAAIVRRPQAAHRTAH